MRRSTLPPWKEVSSKQADSFSLLDLGELYIKLIILFYFVAVSFQGISSDIHGLRKGLDLLKYEREKQPDNAIIEVEY